MKRIAAALAVWCLAAGLAPGQGLNIVRFRPQYSVPERGQGAILHGPTRVDAKNLKIVQGDVLYATYAITGLKSTKDGKVSYEIVLELVDNKTNKPIMRRPTSNEAMPQLGGGEMPGDLFMTFGSAFKVGKYTINLEVKDKIANQSVKKPIPVEIIPEQLAFVHVNATALALPGDRAGVACSIIGFALDKKKIPNVEVFIRLLDANGKPVTEPAVQMSFPKDLPEGVDRTNPLFLPVIYIVSANRPGQFVFELTAIDKNAKNAELKLRVPLTVLEVGAATAGK